MRASKDDGHRPGRFILRGSPSGASAPQGSHLRMTGRHKFAFSRRDFARALHIPCPHPRSRGRRECRVRAAPAVSCARNCAFGAHEHTGQRKHSDIPCAMALRLTSCSPRWSGLVVTVAGGILPADLAPASRRQDHTTSPYAFVHSSALARLNKSVHRIPRPTYVTIMIRPSIGTGRGVVILIYRNGKRNIFDSRA